jgi:hypothetical protein
VSFSRAASALLCTAVLAAQKPPLDPTLDPYTRGEPAAMQAAGIVAYAPLPWADDHSTRDIDEELGTNPRICWAETKHFKLGIGLRPRAWPVDKTERRQLQEEIATLARKLPELKHCKQIDSWVLVHLYASRLEELYADFEKRIGCEEPAVLDKTPSDGRGWPTRGGLGRGPYLGQYGKYCVLVLEQNGDVVRYMARFAQRQVTGPVSHHFLKSNTLLYIATPDLRTRSLSTERALFANVVYGAARNLVDGYRGFTYEIPVWITEGVAHWYSHRFDPRYDSFCTLPESQFGIAVNADWEEKAKARVLTGAFDAAEDLLQWQADECSDFTKHVMVWSRIDFLLEAKPAEFAKFLRLMKSLGTNGVPRRLVLEMQQDAMETVFHWNADEFDQQWCQWVKKTYPRRK